MRREGKHGTRYGYRLAPEVTETTETRSEPAAGQKDESAAAPIDGSPSTSAQEVVDTVHEAHTEQNPDIADQEDDTNG